MQLPDKIWHSITQDKDVLGIELFYKDDGTMSVNCCELSQKKDSISVKKHYNSNGFDLSELKKSISGKLPVILTVNGKGIVNKKVNHSAGESERTVFAKTFPNIKEQDFCIQQTYIDETHSYLSLIRKDIVNDLLSQFKENGVIIVKLYLSVFPVNFILPLLTPEIISGGVLQVHNTSIEFAKSHITSVNLSVETKHLNSIVIGSEVVREENLLAYSAALSYYVGNSDLVKVDIDVIENSAQEYKDKRLFQTGGKLMLAFLVSVLLLNYGFFNYYFSKKSALTTEVSSEMDEINKIDTLKSELQKKRSFLNKSGFLSDSKTSYYADRLAISVPEGILLDEMCISPLIRKSDSDTSNIMSFIQDAILLTGTSKSSVYVGNWIKVIKQNNWVKNAELISYDHDKELNAGRFNIQIKLKH